MPEFSQRGRTHANLQYFFGPVAVGPQQQTTHHFAGIFQLQRIGSRNPHGTLNPLGAKMQESHTGFFRGFNAVRIFGHNRVVKSLPASGG